MQSGMTIKNTLDSCVRSVPTFLAALTRSRPITDFAVSPVFATTALNAITSRIVGL